MYVTLFKKLKKLNTLGVCQTIYDIHFGCDSNYDYQSSRITVEINKQILILHEIASSKVTLKKIYDLMLFKICKKNI